MMFLVIWVVCALIHISLHTHTAISPDLRTAEPGGATQLPESLTLPDSDSLSTSLDTGHSPPLSWQCCWPLHEVFWLAPSLSFEQVNLIWFTQTMSVKSLSTRQRQIWTVSSHSDTYRANNHTKGILLSPIIGKIYTKIECLFHTSRVKTIKVTAIKEWKGYKQTSIHIYCSYHCKLIQLLLGKYILIFYDCRQFGLKFHFLAYTCYLGTSL